jgi:hypothetical protein
MHRSSWENLPVLLPGKIYQSYSLGKFTSPTPWENLPVLLPGKIYQSFPHNPAPIADLTAPAIARPNGSGTPFPTALIAPAIVKFGNSKSSGKP